MSGWRCSTDSGGSFRDQCCIGGPQRQFTAFGKARRTLYQLLLASRIANGDRPPLATTLGGEPGCGIGECHGPSTVSAAFRVPVASAIVSIDFGRY